ncbi:MAG: hypothetical protein QM650_02780 [Microlunatus sp.]
MPDQPTNSPATISELLNLDVPGEPRQAAVYFAATVIAIAGHHPEQPVADVVRESMDTTRVFLESVTATSS